MVRSLTSTRLPVVGDQSGISIGRNLEQFFFTKLLQYSRIPEMFNLNRSLGVMPEHLNEFQVRTLT